LPAAAFGLISFDPHVFLTPHRRAIMIRRFSFAALAAAMILGTSGLSHAATATAGKGGGSPAGQRIKTALAQLDLSTVQKEKIKQIFTEAKGNAAAKSGSATATKGTGRAMIEKIVAVLTPAQKAKFKQLMKASKPATSAAKP
jgi:Spy/CpxP family protein refolding chaperone